MTWRGEVEDGAGWGGLVETKAEREARKAHRAEMLKHYASGLEDGRADVLAKFAALLPDRQVHESGARLLRQRMLERRTTERRCRRVRRSCADAAGVTR